MKNKPPTPPPEPVAVVEEKPPTPPKPKYDPFAALRELVRQKAREVQAQAEAKKK